MESEVAELRATRTTGAFACFSGAVFGNYFNPSVHVIDPMPKIPDGWRHIRGLDFGYNHNTCCLWVAVDAVGRYYVYHEYFSPGKTMAEHLFAINSAPYPWNYKDPCYGPCYADFGGAQERKELSALGFHTAAARKGPNEVNLSIEVIRRMLSPGPDGKPRLYICRNCENLIKQMKTYQWHPFIDKPLAVDDDACSSARYAIFSDYCLHAKPFDPLLRKPEGKQDWWDSSDRRDRNTRYMHENRTLKVRI